MSETKRTDIPWRVGHDGPSRPIITTANQKMLSLSGFENGRWISYDGEDDDAEFIVSAVNAHAANIARIAELEKALDAAKSILWMAEKYAEGGGSHSGEMRDYLEATEKIDAADGDARRLLDKGDDNLEAQPSA